MADNRKILIVDDEKDILELLEYNLEKEGFDVQTANNGMQAVEIAREFIPDLILLDIMMPVMDGVETCRQLREVIELNDTFIIFLTARSEEYSEVAGFEAGGDDYLNKPIKPRALISRLKAMFRRKRKLSKKEEYIEIGDLKIDRTSYSVLVGKMEVRLPKKEFELLYFLAESPNKVFSRDDLLKHVWGTDVYVLARTVDVHIRKVREKIGDGYITTVKGVGYKLAIS